jgi:hypothetical protein
MDQKLHCCFTPGEKNPPEKAGVKFEFQNEAQGKIGKIGLHNFEGNPIPLDLLEIQPKKK